MGHHTETRFVPSAEGMTARDALSVAVSEMAYDNGSNYNERVTEFDKSPMMTKNQAYKAPEKFIKSGYGNWAHNELMTQVIPVCRDEDVLQDKVEVKVNLSAEQYEAFNKKGAFRGTPASVLEVLGVALPKKFVGREKDILRVNVPEDKWDFTSRIEQGATEGTMKKEFFVVTSAEHYRVPPAAAPLLRQTFVSQAEASKAIRDLLMENVNLVDLTFSVRSRNIREGGNENLMQFKRVVTKARNTVTIEFEKMKPNAKQAGWVVMFDVHS